MLCCYVVDVCNTVQPCTDKEVYREGVASCPLGE